MTLSARAFWENRSRRFAETARDPTSFYARRARWVAESVARTRPAGRALDVGCGTGRLCFELAARGFDVHGTDLSAAQIDEAVRAGRGVLNDPEERFRVGTPELIPFDGSFDVVTAIGVLPYVSDHAVFLKRVIALLRPEGLLVLSSTNPRSLFTILALEKHFRHVALSPAWWAVVVNLVRTGVWSGGFVDPRTARQVRTPRALARLCREHGLVREATVDLYNIERFGLDASPLQRGRLARGLARLLGWSHLGFYRLIASNA